MTNAKIIVAGPTSLDELPEPVLGALELGRAQWLDVEDALQWLADAPARTTAAGAQAAGAHLWWFYRAPWDAGPEGTYADPAVWLGGQRRFLRSRLRAAGRVSTWNLSRPAEQMPPELCGLLLGADADDEPVARSTHPTNGGADAGFVRSASGPTDALGGLIAHVIALAFPACWDVFEALEGLAPHATPGLASREELPAPSTEALAELTRRLNSAREVAALAARQDQLLQRAEAAEHALREEAGLRGRLESESRLAAARAAAEAAELHAALASARDETQVARQQALSIGAERDTAKQALAGAQSALDQATRQLADAHSAHAQTLAQLTQDAAALTAERDQSRQALEAAQAQLKESKEEGELLLLQLHQVQEELEQLFLQGKDKDTAHQKAQSDAKAALEKANQATKQAADQAAKALAGAKADHDKALAEAQAQIKARTTERDAKARDVAEAQAQLSQRTAERDQARKALEAAQAQLKESQEEGELLLLQLHQVQEELETHFLRGKDLEQELQQMRRRHERMQRRHPEAVDVDAIEIAEVDASAAVPLLTWRLKGLSVQGRIWPELTLKTTLGPKGFGLQLDAPAGSVLAGCMDGPLIPKALVARDAEQVQRFRMLGASAWRCLVTACAAADEALATPSLIESLPAGFDAVFWKQALGPAAPVLRALPPAFRHDGVKLKREKVNPDYEHLWLVFEGAGHGSMELGSLELRLGAAQVMPGLFSHQPKLEFPSRADGAKPFEGWYPESIDDVGSKLELRADLSRQAFDLGVWTKLPTGTQSMLLSLIAVLPPTLEDLATSGARITRPWADWISMVNGLIEVIRQRLVSAKAAAVAQKAAGPVGAARNAIAAPAVPSAAPSARANVPMQAPALESRASDSKRTPKASLKGAAKVASKPRGAVR